MRGDVKGVIAGTMRVRIRPDANDQLILAEVLEIFSDCTDDLSVEVSCAVPFPFGLFFLWLI